VRERFRRCRSRRLLRTTPEHLRMAYSVLKNGQFVPEEVRLMQDIEAAGKVLQTCDDAGRRAELEKEIREKVLGLSMLLERRPRHKTRI